MTTQDSSFGRDAYLGLADEFDPMGQDPNAPAPSLFDFDDKFIQAAKAFAVDRDLPLPWTLGSIDEAARLVDQSDKNIEMNPDALTERERAQCDCIPYGQGEYSSDHQAGCPAKFVHR